MRYAIFENLDKAKSILKSKEISFGDPLFLKIRQKLEKNNRLGYLGWLVSLLYEKNQNKDEVLGIVDTILQPAFKETSTWFTKNILEIETSEEFTDQLNIARNRKLAKNMWLKFPSDQKKLIDWEDSNYSVLLIRLWDAKYDNLINKISRYKTKGDLVDEIKIVLSTSNMGNLQSFVDICNSNNIEILYLSYENDILIANAKSHYDVLSLAKDSSWCIRSKDTFKGYLTPHNFYGIMIEKKQIIIINTDELGNYRKIGATIGMGVSAAHLWNDDRINGIDLSGYLAKKGFDLNSLIIKIDQDIINESWIIENLKNKISFKSFISIIDKFNVKISKRMSCWKYISVEGIFDFYTKDEFKVLSRDINFIKYLSGIKYTEESFSIESYGLNSTSIYLFGVMTELGHLVKIKNGNIPIPENSEDLIEVCLKYFQDSTISQLAKRGFLLAKHAEFVYSKHELLKKYGYTIKSYSPSLGDVIYLSDKNVIEWGGDLCRDVEKNLYMYHKLGYKTIQMCLDRLRTLCVYKTKWGKETKEVLSLENIVVPNDFSMKEIFETYFKDSAFNYKYNFYDFLNVSDRELLENIDYMPRLSTNNKYVDRIIDRSIKVLGKKTAIEYFINSKFSLKDINNFVPYLFFETIEVMKVSKKWYKYELDIDSLNKLNKKQIIDIISNGHFEIDLGDESIKSKISDLNIDPKIATKYRESFMGNIYHFFELYYNKTNYKLFRNFANEIRDGYNDYKMPISVIECYILNHLDEPISATSINIERFVGRYLRDGSDDEIKSNIVHIKESYDFSNLVRKSVKRKSQLIEKCDEILKDTERSKKMWSEIVLGIFSDITPENKIGDSGYYYDEKVKPDEAITKELAETQAERFSNLIPEKIKEDIFKSERLRSVWKIVKPGCYIINTWENIKLDAYLISKCLLDENPETQLMKMFELYKMAYKNKKDITMPGFISDLKKSCFIKLSIDQIVGLINSIPNNMENKRAKQNLVYYMIDYHIDSIRKEVGIKYHDRIVNMKDTEVSEILKRCNKILIDLGMSLLNKPDRLSLGIENRNPKAKK